MVCPSLPAAVPVSRNAVCCCAWAMPRNSNKSMPNAVLLFICNYLKLFSVVQCRRTVAKERFIFEVGASAFIKLFFHLFNQRRIRSEERRVGKEGRAGWSPEN